MRIGVLLIGQTRDFHLSVPHLRKEFEMDGVDVDYFCHTWDSTVNFSPWDNMTNTDNRFSDVKKEDCAKINDQLQQIAPKSIHIDTYNSLEPIFDTIYFPEQHNLTGGFVDSAFDAPGWEKFDHTSKIKFNDWVYYFSVFGQFFSTARAMDLLIDYEKKTGLKYDIIVRWRYDLVSNYESRTYKSKFDHWISEPLKSNNGNTIFFNNLNLWNNMLCAADHYWFGTAGAMKSFTSDIDKKYISVLRSKILESKMVLNENIILDVARNQRMGVEESPIGITIVRPGANRTFTFDDFSELAIKHEKQKRTLAGNI